MRGNREIENNTVNLWLGEDFHTKCGGGSISEIGCSLGAWGGIGKPSNYYDFGCMIATDTLLDSRGGGFGISLSNEDMADFEILKVICNGFSQNWWKSSF